MNLHFSDCRLLIILGTHPKFPLPLLGCDPKKDLILAEDSEELSKEEIVTELSKFNQRKAKYLERFENVAGWDHKKRRRWLNKFIQKFGKLEDALEVIKSPASSGCEKFKAFSYLVGCYNSVRRPKEKIRADRFQSLIINNRATEELEECIKLVKTLGKQVLIQARNQFLKKTFPKRQSNLIKVLSRSLATHLKGRVVVLVGWYHGSTSGNPFINEAHKLQDALKGVSFDFIGDNLLETLAIGKLITKAAGSGVN